MDRLKQQTAIVTGASSGIGRACVVEMAREGANVVVNYAVAATRADAEDVLAEIKSFGGTAVAIQCDVSQENEVQAMFAATIQRFGTVDILVNNAGLQRDASFAEMTLEQWNFVMAVNLTGQFLCAREAVREFLKRGFKPYSQALGKIVCMSSVHEVIPWGGHVNYAASKGGVMLMMKSIAQEMAPKKIRCNSIGPGAIKTPINRSAWETPEALRSLLTLIPYERVGEPGDIARAAVWLASDESDYVTGTTLFVDGGMTLYPGFATGG